MNAPETIKPINAAHIALLNSEDALCVDAVATATGLKKRGAAKQLKELAGLGMIEPEFRAGGVPFYRLISAPAAPAVPAVPAPSERVLTPEAQADRDDFVSSYGDDGNCSCHLSAPCASCMHPGNPLQQDEDESCWMTVSDSEGGEADAPADFATTPELQYLAPEDYEMPPADPALLAAANRALGEQLEAVKAELEIERGRLAACGVVAMCDTPESAKKARDMREEYRSASCDDVARRVDECMALRTERDDLRARLDAVTQQSIADTDALTAQIEHLRAELAERDSHLHKITSDTGRSDIAQRLIDHNDDRLYHEADMLMYEASDAITMLEHERDQLRAELETARAEAIALKTLEGAMPGFGTAHDAQRIASLTAELQTLRTSNANAINEADRLRAELATERQAREALQEQAGDDAVDVKDAAVGYLVRVPKRRPMMRTKPESARAAALSAVRSGAAHAEVLAVVPVGTARRGAEWRAK